jgi:hypothetical protein
MCASETVVPISHYCRIAEFCAQLAKPFVIEYDLKSGKITR